MTKKDYLKYWLEVALDDWDTAESLIKAKKYHHALFFFHLSLEKLIKGLVYKKTDIHPLPIHDLLKLVFQAQIEVSDKMKNDLGEISSWCIKARYDNIKRELYKKASREFTLKWFKKVKEMFLWFKNQY